MSRRKRRLRLTIWPVLFAVAVVLVGILAAGCEPPGGGPEPLPAGTFIFHPSDTEEPTS